jgi:hypothetical protein
MTRGCGRFIRPMHFHTPSVGSGLTLSLYRLGLQRPRTADSRSTVSGKLTANDLAEIGSAASKITVKGGRYPEQMAKMAKG